MEGGAGTASLVALVVSAVMTGTLAGLFIAFSVAVMPGLRLVDDHAFVAVMRSINRAILNPLFGLVFVGSLVSPVAASLLLASRGGLAALPWAAAAAGASVLAVAITVVVNVPLNQQLDQAAGTAVAGVAAIRSAFEPRWTRWHHVRTVLTLAASVGSCIALAAHAAG